MKDLRRFDREWFKSAETEGYLRASEAIPGGALTRSKAPGKMFPVFEGPMFAADSSGAFVSDGRAKYIDMLCALGAVVIGHGDIAASRTVLPSLPSPAEGAAARAVLEHVAPWATRVRFLKTGSEATHAAYRIAKRATGRKYVLIGRDSYHGWHEWCERKPDGTPEGAHTLLYTDHEDVYRDAILPNGIGWPDVAAVFVEPNRWRTVSPEWLAALKRACEAAGTLLVFDEMIYGGRWAVGGATEYFGVTPDLACYGKAFGNGASIAFVVGGDVMERHGQLPSGTYSGEVGALETVARVVRAYVNEGVWCGQLLLDRPLVDMLWARGRQLQRGLKDVVEIHRGSGAVLDVEGAPVHQRLRFRDEATALRFGAEMASRGVLVHPACINVMAAHTPAIIEAVVEAAYLSMRSLR